MSEEIQHHISDDILMAYSAGVLPEAFSLMVATHVSMCDVCRAKLESYDALGGAVLDAPSEAVAMSDDSLAATLALARLSKHLPLCCRFCRLCLLLA